MAVIDCDKCMMEEMCMDVLDLNGTIGTCPHFTTLEELTRTAPKPVKKVDCGKCMFEVECEKAWIVDGRAETCDSFCPA